MGKCISLFILVAAVSASILPAQSAWTVKPEWVAAHEHFLAGEALAGRGSATRDEQIAAAYVAAQFEGYGLKPAPGMKDFIQPVPLVSPRLDGKAKLTMGTVAFEEEAEELKIFFATATPAQGPLVRVKGAELKEAKFPEGSVVLVEDLHEMQLLFTAYRSLGQKKIPLILVAENKEIGAAYTAMAARFRAPIRLADDRASQNATLIMISAKAAERLKGVAAGTTGELAAHYKPETEPRFTWNAIGYLQGSDAKAGTLLLTAHLDHLGIGRAVDGDSLYNGANDDASGTAAVLELAHALAAGKQPRRSILFVCYGSEELGLLGSRYFGNHMPIPITELVANLEFEMIGAQDPMMPSGVLMFTGWERSNLGPTLKAHGALVGPDPHPEQHFFERSDNYSLALQGLVAHTSSGWGTVPTYHRPNDDVEHIDLPYMTRAIQSLVEPVRWLATSDFKPEWNPGGRPQPR